jgi:ABC-type Zn uptake system ZnuABC Zn-binding protein ZnuA
MPRTTMPATTRRLLALSTLLALGLAATGARAAEARAPLRVCATIPDLGSLAREVGGERVTVTVFTKGPEDPHFAQAKPSFVKALSEADLYLQAGLDLELGWAPVLLRNARNAAVLPGGRGHLDASVVVDPLEIPAVSVDRSMGDVHPFGNPHYLLDPLNGLRVARLIRDKLAELDPSGRAAYEERYERFRGRLAAALVGEPLARKYDAEKLALLHEHGRLATFLRAQGDDGALGGWLGTVLPHYGATAVSDHNMWPYFARRFGLEVVGYMEPKPGIPPTTRHLGDLLELMRARGVRLILAAPYYDPRHARFLAERTGARVLAMTHQVGGREGTDDYLAMVDANVRQVAAALAGAGAAS